MSSLKGDYLQWENENNIYDYFIINTLENSRNDDAVIFDGIKMTYQELDRNINLISNYIYINLASIQNGDTSKVIGVHLSPDLHLVSILMAIHRLSCSYVPIDHNLPPERIKYILNNAKLDCIITNAQEDNLILTTLNSDRLDIPVLNLVDALKINLDSRIDSEIKAIKRSTNDIACVLYTSGSTGNPKGVRLTHGNIMNRIEWQWAAFPLVKNVDFGIQKTSLNFVDHIAEIFAFILKGLPLVIVESSKISNIPMFVDTMHQNKITYLILVPSLLKNIINYMKVKKAEIYKLKSIKRWVCSGEALNFKTLEEFFDMNLENAVLSNFYGSTEVTADLTYITFEFKKDILPYKHSSIPIGFPISNSSVEILDGDMNLVKCGEVGEIYAIGLCLAHGYLNKIDTDATFLIHNGIKKFKTGDYGYISNNILYYVGRQDTQIKIRGKRVDLNEIEYNALKLNEIDQFIPLVYENETNKSIIGFYKTKTEVSNNDIEKIILEKLKAVVFDYMLPNKLVRLFSIPYLFNGKIDKKSLLELYETSFFNNSNKTDENCNSITTNTVIGIIESVTKIKIDSTNDFNISLNSIGIDSLNMLDIFLLLEAHGVEISFNAFLSALSLAELIKICDRRQKGEAEINICDNERIIYTNTELGEKLKVIKFSEQSLADEVLRMCSETYSKKSPLEINLGISEDDFYQEFYPLVDILKNSEESFAVINTQTGKLVGGAFLCDITVPIVFNERKIKPLLAFLDETKMDIVEIFLNENKKVLHSMLVTTTLDCNFNENVIIIDFIESEIISIAKKFCYNVIVTVNTIKLTEVGYENLSFCNSL
jgi:acyl-coenzyme A synthetase/AMP-(fatty) acid ligase/acyl carrier protein